MSLTHEQKVIVQTTFRQVIDADQLAGRFYDRLFEIDPSTQPLFKHSIADQRKKLMQTLSVVVNGLDDLEMIVVAVQKLGQRHVAYGVTLAHWDSVGEALLWALADAFGDAFTDDVYDAWATAYGMIAQTAIEVMYPSAN